MLKDETPIRILYIHGYNEKACEGLGMRKPYHQIAIELSKHDFRHDLGCPVLPIDNPNKMVKMLDRITEEDQYDFIIASDIGAIYAMQIKSGFKILINPAIPENVESLQRASGTDANLVETFKLMQNYYFKICHDEEDDFKTYFLYGTDSVYAANEFFYNEHFKDATHVFHGEMGPVLDEKGAEKIRIIIELLKDKYPDFNFEKERKAERYFLKKRYEESVMDSDETGEEHTVFGLPIDDFLSQDGDTMIATLFGTISEWYSTYRITCLVLSTRSYNLIAGYLDPPLTAPNGTHLTMDELMRLTVGQLRDIRNMDDVCFAEILEKTDEFVNYLKDKNYD